MSTSSVTEERANRPLLLAFLLLVPASLMAIAAAGAGTLPGDVVIARAVQDLGLPGSEQLAWLGWLLGGTPAATAIAVTIALVLYLRGQVAPSLLMALTTLVLHANYAIKWLVESPRPTADQVRVIEDAKFYGFPSGHVMTAMIVYGVVFFLAPSLSRREGVQKLIRAGAVGAILITSFGRVYTGAHWPSDVGGGYLWGAVALLLLIAVYRATRLRWGEQLSADTPMAAKRETRILDSGSPRLT